MIFIIIFYKDTYRNKDILIIEQSGHLFPFEIIDHSETSRVQVIFYVVRHERGRIQIPIHDIGRFGQKGHLARQSDTKSTSMSTIKQLNIIHLLSKVEGNTIHPLTGFDGNMLICQTRELYCILRSCCQRQQFGKRVLQNPFCMENQWKMF